MDSISDSDELIAVGHFIGHVGTHHRGRAALVHTVTAAQTVISMDSNC